MEQFGDTMQAELPPKDVNGMANIADPNQTAPLETVCNLLLPSETVVLGK